VRVARQSVMDLDARLQGVIVLEGSRHEQAIGELSEKVLAVTFGDFGFAYLSLVPLLVGAAFELAANFA
jgi:hypothetical protein